MAIDYSGLISEGGRAALSSIKNMPPDQQRAKMNDMLANGLLPFSVAMAVDKQLREPLKENAPSPRPGSVMEEKLNLLNQVQGGGIDQLPAPDMQQAQFAGGGIVAFDDGGATDEPDPFAGLAGMTPKDSNYPLMQWLKSRHNQSKTNPKLSQHQQDVDAEQKAGGYGKYSKAALDYADILKGREKGIDEAGDERKARRAGWLAMAQAGAEGKGLLAGATAGFSKYGEISDAREEKRKTELRDLQKEQYTLQLGREQALAAGNQEAVKRYDAALDRNSKAQEMVGRGVMSLYEMQSKERIAAQDRAVTADKDFNVDSRYGKIDFDLSRRIAASTDPAEIAQLEAQKAENIKNWTAANRASRYGVVPQIRNEGALDAATLKSYADNLKMIRSRISAKRNKINLLVGEGDQDAIAVAIAELTDLEKEESDMLDKMYGQMSGGGGDGYPGSPPADDGTQAPGQGSNPQVPRAPTALPPGA